jgi:uroporphyrinogen-III synthase
MKILILRPQPGADETAARARALGLEPLVAPLFTIRPIDWTPLDPAGFDAVLLTSANAPRHAGDAMTSFLGLPCYAVGESTAAAARAAGFTDIRTGPSDGRALIEKAAGDGIAAAVHLCGRHHFAIRHPAVAVTPVVVYAAEPAARMPEGTEDALVLLHSPRAAALLARLAGERRGHIRIAAISSEAAAAAGSGWASAAIAGEPRDQALLALAAKLCQT